MSAAPQLFLIAHKVRGEPAFDVAAQMECPMCQEAGAASVLCHECDSLGYWWIIPTSGHRAYPYWHGAKPLYGKILEQMPEGLPDHYTTRAAPRVDLTTALGLRATSASPLPPLPRRL